MSVLGLIAMALNPVEAENALRGSEEWLQGRFGTQRIEGFVSSTSVKAGKELRIFARNTSPTYRVEIYRMGWYSGLGARLVYRSDELPQATQPDCLYDETFRMVSCHNWRESHRVTIPANWLAGLYWVRFAEADGATTWFTATAFVLRDEESGADFLMQIPFNRHQMYNAYAGRAWHYGPEGFEGRALKISFDRPSDRAAGRSRFRSTTR